MFTAYGLNGRIFSGPLDGLRALGPVQAVARLRAVEPVLGDGPVSPAVLGLESPALPRVPPSVVLAGPNPEASLVHLGNAEPRQRDALAAYAQAQAEGEAGTSARQPLNLVEQLMTRRLITVPLTATVAEGLTQLARARVGQAPVLDAQGRLVGLLLRADLLPQPQHVADAVAWAAWFEQPVAQLMWTPVPAAHPDTPIRAVAQALLDLRLPGLPVLDDEGGLIGFLSRSDILRALTREPPLDLWS